jgi:hypothetical protein
LRSGGSLNAMGVTVTRLIFTGAPPLRGLMGGIYPR